MLLTVGLLLLALAGVGWLEGSAISSGIAYVAAVLGLLPVAWGLFLRWRRQSRAAFIGSALALVSLVMVAPGILGSLDPASLVIGLASLATIILGLALGVHRFR